VKNIIRQNKKGALLEFLFGSNSGRGDSYKGSNSPLEELIQNLQNQVHSLQKRILELENQILVKDSNRNVLSKGTNSAHKAPFTSQQGDYTLKPKMHSYLQENDNKINSNLQQVEEFRNEISESVLKTAERSEEYHLSSSQDGSNFITLGKILEEEKIEIIKLGFQLQNEGKISLKKYYESTDTYSLFQLKGYNIKYESIQRNKLYKSLKDHY
jgi:hypothetical protein